MYHRSKSIKKNFPFRDIFHFTSLHPIHTPFNPSSGHGQKTNTKPFLQRTPKNAIYPRVEKCYFFYNDNNSFIFHTVYSPYWKRLFNFRPPVFQTPFHFIYLLFFVTFFFQTVSPPFFFLLYPGLPELSFLGINQREPSLSTKTVSEYKKSQSLPTRPFIKRLTPAISHALPENMSDKTREPDTESDLPWLLSSYHLHRELDPIALMDEGRGRTLSSSYHNTERFTFWKSFFKFNPSPLLSNFEGSFEM